MRILFPRYFTLHAPSAARAGPARMYPSSVRTQSVLARRFKESAQGSSAHLVPGASSSQQNHWTLAKTLVVWHRILRSADRCFSERYAAPSPSADVAGVRIVRAVSAWLSHCTAERRLGLARIRRRQRPLCRANVLPLPLPLPLQSGTV